MMDYKLFTLPLHIDTRGYFLEQYNSSDYLIDGFTINQISESMSNPNTFRGFHFQIRNEMNKILRIIQGYAQIYLLNVYEDSPRLITINFHEMNFNKESNRGGFQYLYVPWYYAIGFITFERTQMQYFHDNVFDEKLQRCININSIPGASHILPNIKYISERDTTAPSWDDWKTEYKTRMS
jgi:dTDP-4-dehydrorhamnose 3,5-epimerase-like enzyme